jgi:hypothetical protein
VLDQLPGAAVQEADTRIDALDDLTVELQYQAQYAVRRRMLGPEIEGEIAQSVCGHDGLASAAGSTPPVDRGSNFFGRLRQAAGRALATTAKLAPARGQPSRDLAVKACLAQEITPSERREPGQCLNPSVMTTSVASGS